MHAPHRSSLVLFFALLALGCDDAPLCAEGEVTLTISRTEDAIWLFGDDAPSAGERVYAVTRSGDPTCRVRARADARGVRVDYDPAANELRVSVDRTRAPAGLQSTAVTLEGQVELAALSLDVRHLPDPPADASRHVIVLGVDGLRPDAIAPAQTPTLDVLFAHGHGTLAASTQLTGDTISGPGWASILTGVEVERHGVTSNETAVMSAIDRTVPTLLGAAFSAGLDTGLVVHWLQLPLLVEDEAAQGFRFGLDDAVARHAVSRLEQPMDLLFLHFDDPDHAGHASGYGPDNPDYIDAVEAVDTNVTTAIDGVLARETYATEAWLFVLVTDHGGEGTSHGARDAINRTIPLLFVRPGGGAGQLPAASNHMDVAPTVLQYLGVDTGASYDGRVVTEALPEG